MKRGCRSNHRQFSLAPCGQLELRRGCAVHALGLVDIEPVGQLSEWIGDWLRQGVAKPFTNSN